jgi:hypothetical protein
MFIAGAMLHDDEQLLILGLSRENIRRLQEGQPIDLSQKTHGVAMPRGLKICIFAGETEESMRQQMADLIGPTTIEDQRKPQ